MSIFTNFRIIDRMMGYDADSVKIWERLVFNKYLGTSLKLGQSDTLDYFLNNSEKVKICIAGKHKIERSGKCRSNQTMG